MSTVFTQTSRYMAKKEYSDAYKIIAVDGGFAVFFTATDYQNWRNQK